MRDASERPMDLAKRALREHHAGVGPDPGFASRVTARLPATLDPLRWAAVRLLPAGLAAALVLGVLVWQQMPANDAPSSVDELVAWTVDPFGAGTP